MADFPMPPMSPNFDGGWGPAPEASGVYGLQHLYICDFVEHLDKFPLTKIGKVCDFTIAGLRYAEKGKGKKGKGKGAPLVLKPKDDEGFTLKDSKPLPTKGAGRGKGGSGGRSKGKGKGLSANYQEGILGKKTKVEHQRDAQKGKGKGRGSQHRRGVPSFKEWSVQTKTEWELKQEIMLHSLSKLQLDAKDVKYEDVMWCGTLHTYNRVYDRVTVKTEKKVPRLEELAFFNLSTSNDEILQDQLQSDPTVTVIATDSILASLVAASRSVYSWDLVISKIHGKIVMDKRNGSQIDFLSVNETAAETPNNDDKDNINAPVRLSQEASCINQNFSQMVLDHNVEAEEMEHPNPFDPQDGETQVASGSYRYRKITLPGNAKSDDEFEKQPVVIVVRTEVNAKMPGCDKLSGKGLVSVKAMNEYDPKPNYNWRMHLESQRGACLATEVKNNAFKLGRWTAQAILAGCDTLKLGYVSRQQTNDSYVHSLLGVQTHMTDSMADQIGITRNNMFGILRTIIDLVMKWEDGKYLVLKDPTKSVLRVYEVPWDSFDSEEEEEEEEEEEVQDLDEDGNVAPSQPVGLR